MPWPVIALLFTSAAYAQDNAVGPRPYEMVWADRTEDHHPGCEFSLSVADASHLTDACHHAM